MVARERPRNLARVRTKFGPAFFRQHALPAVLCFGLALVLMPVLERFENVTLDARAKFRTRYFPTQPRDDVVLVGIDQESLSNPNFGRWPWPRALHGNFVQLAGLLKPSVIAYDILFDDPTDDDARFAAGIQRSRVEVVLAGQNSDAASGLKPGSAALEKIRLVSLTHIVGDRTAIPDGELMSVPLAPLGEVAHIGFAYVPPAADGVLREVPMVVRYGDRLYPSLSLRSLMLHWHVTADDVQVKLGDAIVIKNDYVDYRIPIDAKGKYLVNYRHTQDGFSSAGYSEACDYIRARFVDKKDVPVPEFTGRILLVGQTADGLTDFGATPLAPHAPLVLVHANAIENVLNGDFARRAEVWPIWLGGLVVTAGSLAFFSQRKFYQLAAFALGAPVVFAAAATFAWVKFSVWVPIVWPALGFACAQIFMVGRRVLTEQRAKEQIKGMFGTYVSPEVVRQMVASGVSPQLGGHEQEITAYFSDIQGYSTFSEKLPPTKLVELLNEYLTACTDIVQGEGGSLDKYIGDAVVAMFGAPLPLQDHAYRSCVAALRVQAKLDELRAAWDALGDTWPEGVRRMRSRIGLNTGPAIIGNMGSRTRFNYTMTGDNVNLAARMESGAKSWGAYIMTTEATKLACEQHGGDRVVFRPLGRIVVKGRTLAVPIHEVVGLKENVSAQTRECIGLFSAGLDKYYARDWHGARALFEQSLALELNVPGKSPGVSSNPSLVYLNIVEEYRANPPPEGWDGVYVMHEK